MNKEKTTHGRDAADHRPGDAPPTPITTLGDAARIREGSDPQRVVDQTPTGNQGEGDRFSARSYERKLRSFIASGRVEPAAASARRAVNGPERASLDEAEARGRAPAHVSRLQRLLGLSRRVRRAVSRGIEELRRDDDAPTGNHR